MRSRLSCARCWNDRRDGSPLWMVLAILPRTDDAKKIFNSLRVVCGLSGIRVEAPFKKAAPVNATGAKYGHTAAVSLDPRCVKCLVPLDQRVPAHSGVGRNPPVLTAANNIRPIIGDARRLPNSCPGGRLITRGPLAPPSPGIWKTSRHSRV
ncbi:hypothetical protein EVAR_38925_1 [Eumeta japonica]|uniref:Uncharacterized protein n=1 Tax=Eumeta variegata TaxID=151549 RepID=A0A4C1ZSN5_EUMVA|nr:hypothetical protein EVAR_38925_1 [Eumeta japonica]